ncbi:MAG TPA: DUF881 domain-containing protein [Nocardioidaceae bacterium]|nr:DUF881 domain-containing protein [Nocardioidaceae bacterium]
MSKNQLVTAVLLGVLGFAGVIAVKEHRQDTTFTGASQQDLIQIINSQSLAKSRIEAEMEDLETILDALRGDTASSEAGRKALQARAVTLGITAGTLPAVGPGVEIRVEGPPGSAGVEVLLTGIHELLDAGAEAIEINGVRFTVRSWLATSADGDVVVDGKPTKLPFIIRAIGSPVGLDKAVYFQDGFSTQLEAGGASVRVKRFDELEIRSTRNLLPMPESSPAS